jgi:hemolysin III
MNSIMNHKKLTLGSSALAAAGLAFFIVRDHTAKKKVTLSDAVTSMQEGASSAFTDSVEKIQDVLQETFPILRGWFHVAGVPIALLCGIFLLTNATTSAAKMASAIFVVFSLQMFAVSALYHRTKFKVSPQTTKILYKLDHISISFMIAGSFTPYGLMLLEGTEQAIFISMMWGLCFAYAILRFKLSYLSRWIAVPIYFILGWTPVFFFPRFQAHATDLIPMVAESFLLLTVISGILYTVGGILFAVRPKKLEHRWAGHHELFHGFTLLGYFAQYAAIAVVAFNLPV